MSLENAMAYANGRFRRVPVERVVIELEDQRDGVTLELTQQEVDTLGNLLGSHVAGAGSARETLRDILSALEGHRVDRAELKIFGTAEVLYLKEDDEPLTGNRADVAIVDELTTYPVPVKTTGCGAKRVDDFIAPREPKAGDVVRVTEGDEPYYSKGDVGTVRRIDSDGDLYVNFEGHGNKKVFSSGSGPDAASWYVNPSNYEFA